MLINLGQGHWASPADIQHIYTEIKRGWFGPPKGPCLFVLLKNGDEFYLGYPTIAECVREADRIANTVNSVLAPLSFKATD